MKHEGLLLPGMPGPLSDTAKDEFRPLVRGVLSYRTTIPLPAGENLMAFPSRFKSTCCKLSGSALNSGTPAHCPALIVISFASAAGMTREIARGRIPRHSIGCGRISTAPASRREICMR